MVTTVKDPQRRVKVTDLLTGVTERVYPVGRLDYETEGLLLLTNDGELSYRLTHPRYKIPKTYLAKVRGDMSQEALLKLQNGVLLEDGLTQPAQVKIIKKGEGYTSLTIKIREGRNRQMRRMCEAVGHPVLRLRRIAFGPLELGSLSLGHYRYLNQEEIIALKKACRLI